MVSGRVPLLTEDQQWGLIAIAQLRSLPAGYVFRAKLILMLAEGASFRTIKTAALNDCSHDHPLEAALLSLGARWTRDPIIPAKLPRGDGSTTALRARILAATRKKPSDGSTHCSCRKLASALVHQ